MYGYNFYNYRERIVMKLKKQSFSHQQTQHSSKQYGDNMNQQFLIEKMANLNKTLKVTLTGQKPP